MWHTQHGASLCVQCDGSTDGFTRLSDALAGWRTATGGLDAECDRRSYHLEHGHRAQPGRQDRRLCVRYHPTNPGHLQLLRTLKWRVLGELSIAAQSNQLREAQASTVDAERRPARMRTGLSCRALTPLSCFLSLAIPTVRRLSCPCAHTGENSRACTEQGRRRRQAVGRRSREP